MAKKTQKGYKVNTNQKTITLYSNFERTPADEMVIDTYVRNGFKVKIEKKITIDEMRKELKKDKTALAEFERLYVLNEEDGALGFHRACQFYTKWKKENK